MNTPRIIVVALAALTASLLPPAHAGESLKALKKQYVAGCLQGDVNKATSAVILIARLDTKEAVKYLVDEALGLDRYPALDEPAKMKIFEVARESLSQVKNPEARQFLFEEARRLKRPRDVDKKVFLTDVIGRMAGDDSTEALVALLDSKSFPTVQTEAIASLVPRAITTAVLDLVMDPIIGIVAANEAKQNLLWGTADNALVAMTGYAFPDAEGWRMFWATRKGSFDPMKDRGDKKAEGPRSVQRKLPTFFEREILSKRLVFIIDVSNSMHIKDPVTGGEAPAGGHGKGEDAPCPVCGKKHRGVGLDPSRMRVERVKRELVGFLDALPADVKFNILAFSTDVLPWRSGDELHQATPKNIEAAVRWTEKLTYEKFTSTDRALERAFEHREANAFYLLSDGAPFRDQPIPKGPIFDMVDSRNRTRKVKIFTFGFSEDADTDFLKRLSGENGGTFAEVR